METSAVLLLGVCFITLASSNDSFYFFTPWLRRAGAEVCKVCYGDDDCLTFSQARCELYTATTAVLFEDEGPHDPSQLELRNRVDELLLNLVDNASNSADFAECIPLISRYTDCTKENICLGCNSCSCDAQGSWSCNFSQVCRAEEPLWVDHRALVFALETLKGDGNPSFRTKRSLLSQAPQRPQNLTYEDLTEWMYDIKSSSADYNVTNAAGTSALNQDSMFNDVMDQTLSNDSDYIEFDDVLRDIFIENNSHAQDSVITKKSIMDHDYMSLEDTNVKYNEIGDFNMTLESKTTTEAAGLIRAKFNFLEDPTKQMNLTENLTDTKILSKTFPFDNYTDFVTSNDINIFDPIHLMKRAAKLTKRDVAQVSIHDNEIISRDSEKDVNETNVFEELDGGVYQPLNTVIKDKEEELKKLINIRERLLKILNNNQTNEQTFFLNKSEQVDKPNIVHYSFYNLEINPEIEKAFKRNNDIDLDKYVLKLKQDIFTVMKDVAIMQRLSGKAVPEGMKGLIRAMRHYIHKHNELQYISTQTPEGKMNDIRRHFKENRDQFYKKNLVTILELIDKDMPQNNALAPLSTKTRKIMRRILKNYKMYDVAVLGLRLNDPNYNLTNDLKSIGLNWQEMTGKIADSSPWDRLYHMKMLQLILESDINKLNDALALVDFAHSRRMSTLDEHAMSEDMLLRINENLRSIHDKINKIVYLKNRNKKQEVNNILKFMSIDKSKKKETFLKHIRNLLKNSKKDLVNLLRNKVPKTDIIKEIAKKKLSEMTKKKMLEYENVMQKWQNSLGVVRQKRSSFADSVKARLRHILPKYLRGKVDPKINSTKKISKANNHQKNTNKKNRKSHSKRNRNSKMKNVTSTLGTPKPT